MLGSITPLGQRGRTASWGTAVGFHVAGSIAGGGLVGAAAGAVGSLLVRTAGTSLWIAAVALLVAAAVDTAYRGRRLPGPSRQVNEEWLGRYRAWVYGGGFGFQLGMGIATVVTTAGVYAVLIVAAASGSAAAGAAIGAVFGLARSLPLLTARRVVSSDALLRMDERLRRFQPLAVRSAAAGQAALGVAAIALAVGLR